MTHASARGAPCRVRLAVRADLDAIGQVLGRAFEEDPVMRYVVSARPVAPRAAILLRVFAELHVDEEAVYVAEDEASGAMLGAAVWAPPDRWRVPLSAILVRAPSLLRVVGWGGVGKIRVLAAIEREHPREPHHYLAVLGTDPEHQGRGVGAALLAPYLARCDDEGLPAYLESSNEANLGFYRRQGFELTRSHPLEKGPTFHFMWRAAAPRG